MQRSDYEKRARALYEEAYGYDPHGTDEVCLAVLSKEEKIDAASGVFAWSRLSVRELFVLRCSLFRIVLIGRG